MADNKEFIFESGFPGFPGLRKFRLDWREDIAPLEMLTSCEKADTQFLVVNPMFFKPDYAPHLTKEHMNILNVKSKDDLRILVLVTLNLDYSQSTANLACPIMFNTREHKAMQLIFDDGLYSMNEPIFAEGVC